MKMAFSRRFLSRRIPMSCALTSLVISAIYILLTLHEMTLTLPCPPPASVRPVAASETARFPLVEQPIVRFVGNNVDAGHLSHVMAVFSRVGYRRVDWGSWDVMWAHGYPFLLPNISTQIQNMKQHQKVNHFPGTSSFLSKVALVSQKLPSTPIAFKMPDEQKQLGKYAAENPKVLFVQKSSKHRGVKIVSVDEIDFNAAKGTFIQLYVDNPMLIKGRRFDLGIYVTLTSVDPLRAYINDENWRLRFCPQKYYPFNPNNTKSYVVSGDFRNLWQILDKGDLDAKYSSKEVLLKQLRNKGYDVANFTTRLKDIIRNVLLANEKNIIKACKKYKSTRNFFELVRFDFMIDSNLKIYLLEANMSPNLSTKDFRLKTTFHQVMYSMLRLVGVARATTQPILNSTLDAQRMQVSDEDLYSAIDLCTTSARSTHCDDPEFAVCPPCLALRQKRDLQQAYLEHSSRGPWRRAVPSPIGDSLKAQTWDLKSDSGFSKLTPENKLQFLWFRAKCIEDATWCY